MRRRWGLAILGGIVIVGGWLLYQWVMGRSNSNEYIFRWLRQPEEHASLNSAALSRCPGAPFVLPSEGFIGLLWRDDAAPYNPLRRHTGIDIFGAGEPGTVPVYAAYEGYLTRLDDWVSTVIIRHDDPLQPGRTIWTYYTHLADTSGNSFIDEAFPQGTYSKPVDQGTLLGYQGDYNPAFPVAMHLHMSIVTSNDDGSFKNEAIIDNTLDPSPYFGMTLNVDDNPPRPVTCTD
jgi:hypothetical protein